MAYNPEKYREKREKVIGIRKRGLGFGTLATMVSMAIILGLSIVTVPQAISYISTRHLDDAIFKLETGSNWPEDVIAGLNAIKGVKNSVNDKNHTRLVVTFDRRIVTLSIITTVFDQHDISATLLNQVNHRQHQSTMKKEEEELETS
ncbi:MAG: hypothetical protein GY699_22440 [Desulfobacteraceae bacterium]|nr:hypothetical protein [Desulfobacteraceae bacterium]